MDEKGMKKKFEDIMSTIIPQKKKKRKKKKE